MDLFTFNIAEIILLSLLGLFLIIQAIYYFSLYNQLHKHNKAVAEGDLIYEQDLPPVSVIICARNESENLRKYLPSVLEQDYPNFEVIVINDGSTDESEDILSEFEEKYTNLYHTFTPDGARYISRKKLALTLGIKASKHDWLVFTDADCHPASKDWLKLMARNFTSRTEIVLGYSGYDEEEGWFQRKVSFINLFMSMRYLGYALIDKPYMGIGRNIAYRKELFFKNKGFSAHLNLQRGDDDLFINEMATSLNTRVETSPDAIIRMEPTYYRSWKEEKVSYLATSHYYHGLQRYWLGFETATRLFFILSVIATIIEGAVNKQWVVLGAAILVYILRYIMQMVIINKTSADFGERKYYFTLPIFDVLQPIDVLNFKLFRKVRGKADYRKR